MFRGGIVKDSKAYVIEIITGVSKDMIRVDVNIDEK